MILITGKNIVNLALAVNITMMVRNQPLTSSEGHLKIVFSSPHTPPGRVGRQAEHLLTPGAVILAYATGNKCLGGPPFG